VTRRCLDLFCGLGGFSEAFRDAEEWTVTTVDIEERFDPDICADVYNLRPSDFNREYDVVLASPPCTLFSTAGNHGEWDLDARQPAGDRAREHVALLHHTIGLIHALTPRYWYLENPRRSRARWSIGAPDEWVSYCQYGDDRKKDTGLWGEHAPMRFEKCPGRGSNCHTANSEDDGTCAIASMDRTDHAERSKVPYDLSEAIWDAVNAALDGRAAEQSTIAEVSA
jgi:hypothetical protein